MLGCEVTQRIQVLTESKFRCEMKKSSSPPALWLHPPLQISFRHCKCSRLRDGTTSGDAAYGADAPSKYNKKLRCSLPW